MVIRVISPDILSASFDTRLYRSHEKLFEVQSEDRKYLIIAAGLLVGINQWANEDRIFQFHLNLNHDQALVKA